MSSIGSKEVEEWEKKAEVEGLFIKKRIIYVLPRNVMHNLTNMTELKVLNI